MKKFISIVTAIILLSIFCFVLPISAASATATLSGPGTVRAGDTITLIFKLNGNGLFGASGSLSYDSNQLTLLSKKQLIASPWMVEFNGNSMVAYDNNLTNPIKGNKDLFSITFKVKNVTAGTKVTVSYTGVKASDGSTDANIGTISYSTSTAAPLSADNALTSLTVSNAQISPAFSAGTVNYTAEVPFEVSKLTVSAVAADSKAKVSINSPNLTPNGTTNVTVTVTAENGSKKTYAIKVKRAKDPNYVASSNNSLSSITVDSFLLSPTFKANLSSYVVWVPYETKSVKTNAKATDSKANIEISGGDSLLAGQDNTVTVTCIAENGDRNEYKIIVKRAVAHDGSVETTPSEESTSSTPITSNASTDPEPSKGFPLWGALLMLAGGLGAGYGVGLITKTKRSR